MIFSLINYDYDNDTYNDDDNNVIHLTGAATNPWIIYEYDDSFIKFEIWPINLIWNSFISYIFYPVHFQWSEFISPPTTPKKSTFNSKLQLHFNLKL